MLDPELEDDEAADDEPWEPPGPVEIPIDGTLDLHTFRPAEVKELVPDYLQECRHKGILEVRIVHGKGSGSLRRSVHAILARLPYVAAYRLGDETSGSWGATLATLHALTHDPGRPPAEGDARDADR